jgi:excisionase family DNA binding protein
MALKNTYFTISEAAKELGVSRQTVYRWIEDEKIPKEKIGGVILVRKQAIRNFMRKKGRESFFQYMDSRLEGAIRKEFGFKSEDSLEEIKGGEDYEAYLVTHKDGSQEKVRFSGVEITMTSMKSEHKIKVEIKLKGAKIVKQSEPMSENKELVKK